MLAYRFALYFPRFVTHLVTFVVPYGPPLPEYHRPQDLVKRCPDFGYQIQFGSEDGVIERRTQDRKGIRLFLNGLYGGSTPDGKYAFDAVIGVDFDLLPHLSPTKLLDDEELQFYVEEYSRKGLRGPCKCRTYLNLSRWQTKRTTCQATTIVRHTKTSWMSCAFSRRKTENR